VFNIPVWKGWQAVASFWISVTGQSVFIRHKHGEAWGHATNAMPASPASNMTFSDLHRKMALTRGTTGCIPENDTVTFQFPFWLQPRIGHIHGR